MGPAHCAIVAVLLALTMASEFALAQPKVILISLDGAQPDIVREYLKSGVLPRDQGLGLLQTKGVVAQRNITATPSLTAVSHIAIATGSTAVHNDIPANAFKLVVSPAANALSGFAAPIGGYDVHGPQATTTPTATPMWVTLRAAGKNVVTATWPGADGVDIRAPGVAGSPLLQAATPTRTVDYTVPFGSFGGLGAQGFSNLNAASFAPDANIQAQLADAGHTSFSPAQVTQLPIETLWCPPSGVAGNCANSGSPVRTMSYAIKVAAVDSSDDLVVNYDTLVFFDARRGIAAGPYTLPATGPAYVKLGGPAGRFFFEGTENRIGTAYFVSHLAPDLSSLRIARYGASFIPRSAPVQANVDDINQLVGFWSAQADFRIPERLSPGFNDFPDLELEAIYEDQVKSFVDYQTRLALHAIKRNPDADLLMVYIEQPDGSAHQFSLTDPRQASDVTNPATIGKPGKPAGAVGQDAVKVARYADYVKAAYRHANEAVQRIIDAAGVDANGMPESNIIVVSDHGMAPFHTAVNLTNLLRKANIDLNSIRITTNGPATNIYVNLAGREQGGTVDAAAYPKLLEAISIALKKAEDVNSLFNDSLSGNHIFATVHERPLDCGRVGYCVNHHIGQDFGDIFAQLAPGYSFDGTQTPGVARLGDAPYDSAISVFSVPNFYGAHGYESALDSMSAILFAAGPEIQPNVHLDQVRNIDIAPTVMQILGVKPAATVDGSVLHKMLRH